MAQLNKVSIGHSPDPDDAFMFYGFNRGISLDGYGISTTISDIQTLNRKVINSELDVSAVSAMIYPTIHKHYDILPCGSSVGRNYGPVVLSKKSLSIKDLQGKVVAIPGYDTTAYAVLRLFVHNIIPKEIPFDQIMPALLSDQVEVALIIHEPQLNFARLGLNQCVNLGQMWFEKYQLPLPLGLNVIKKNLPQNLKTELIQKLILSIRFSYAHLDQSLMYAQTFSTDTDIENVKKFIHMYVNEHDVYSIQKDVLESLVFLYEKGYENLMIPSFANPIIAHE